MSDYTIDDVEAYLSKHPILTPTDPATVLDPVAVAIDSGDPGATDPEPDLESEPGSDEGGEREGEGDLPVAEPATDDPSAPLSEPETIPPAGLPPEDIPDGNLTDDELAQLRAIRDTIIADPGLQRQLVDYYSGTAPAPAPAPGYPLATATTGPQAPVSPDPAGALDLDDPQIAALYGLIQQQQASLQSFAQSHTQLAAQQEAAFRAQTESLLNRAVSSYQSDHSLSDDDMNRLVAVTGRLGVLPHLMSGTDPVTGLPSSPDPLAAVARALDIGRSQLPDLAAQQQQRVAQRTREVNHRKQRLQAVSGSSGSAPRTPPPKASDPREALLESVTQMFEGQFQEN